MSDLFWLTDEELARLQPFFPKSHGKPRVDDRRALSGIVFVNRNGLRWRVAPAAYGRPKTLYNRWKRWGEAGVFTRMMEGLAAVGAGQPGSVSSWSISSDAMNMGGKVTQMTPASTFHADWDGAWNDATIRIWTDNCINKLLNCSAGDVGATGR